MDTLNQLFSLLEEHNLYNQYLIYYKRSKLNTIWYKLMKVLGVISEEQYEKDTIKLIASYIDSSFISSYIKEKATSILHQTS